MIDRVNQTVVLSGGRRLGFAEYGSLQGKPLFLFHGQPGNRLFRPVDEITLRRHAVRLIVPDRPGYGLSSFVPGRTLMDWCSDVLALADWLALENFAVAGFSGGAAYALACAKVLDERLTRAGVISGAPEMHDSLTKKKMPLLPKLNAALGKFTPRLYTWVFAQYWKSSSRKPAGFLRLAMDQMAAVDSRLLDKPEFYKLMLEVWKENLRVSSLGYAYDGLLLLQPWGFRLEEITRPVYLWHGTEDKNVPVELARALVARLPHCEAHFLPGRGHFLFFHCLEEILTTLTA